MEPENYDSEIPVDFFIEVNIPCLICAIDVENDNIVKQEVSESGEFTEDVTRYQKYATENVDHNIFHWFLKWFRVNIVKIGKQKLINRGWDGFGGDILRFCGNCKMELMEILELQKQVDELEESIKNGLGEVKGKMERSEKHVQCTGIYERDQRYKSVRSKIVKCVGGKSSRSDNQPTSSLNAVDDLPSSSRRSSRRKTDIVESESIDKSPIPNDTDDSKSKYPVVMISSLDKTRRQR